MLGWTKWAIAIAIAGLAVGGAAPAIAGDTTVAVQRLGPPDVEARSVGRDGWSALNIATMHYGWDLKRQGDRIEFDALYYGTAYFDKDLNDIDLDFVELTLGPSFNMKRWNLDKTRTYLYAIGDFSDLGYNINFNKATNTLFANLTVHSDI